MDSDFHNWFKSFDFVKYFDNTVHSMEFMNGHWKKDDIMKDLNEGFRTIKCSICKENSQWINFDKKTCYCEEHIKKHDCSDNQTIDIDGIIKEFKTKLEKMEQYLVYIHEKYNCFEDPNSNVNLNSKHERELKEIKESLERKIEAFHDCIKGLQNNRSLESYFEVMESYYRFKVIVLEVVKMISDLLDEGKKGKLLKTIDEDLTIIHKRNEKLEEETKEESMEESMEESKEESKKESKEEIKGVLKEEINEEQKVKLEFLKQPVIFNKKINIMVVDYLSDKKINQLHTNIY